MGERKLWRRLLVVLVVGVLVLYGGVHLLTSRFAWARSVAWMESDVGDQHRFPAREILTADRASALPKGPEPAALSRPVNLGLVGRPFEAYLEKTGTRAFLVVHHDQLVYERYLDGTRRDDRQTSFSAANSLLSTLVGIAVDKGYVDLTDTVKTYLPYL
ncbi:MAG: hypothetical protein ACTHKG_21985, partial [Nocardioides sp.]